MIKVKLEKENAKYKKITMTGHANHDEYGKDIVCAAASSIVITSVNAILKIDEKAITVNDDDGLEIVVNTYDYVVEVLISNMIDLLKELKEQYKENIKIINI